MFYSYVKVWNDFEIVGMKLFALHSGLIPSTCQADLFETGIECFAYWAPRVPAVS